MSGVFGSSANCPQKVVAITNQERPLTARMTKTNSDKHFQTQHQHAAAEPNRVEKEENHVSESPAKSRKGEEQKKKKRPKEARLSKKSKPHGAGLLARFQRGTPRG